MKTPVPTLAAVVFDWAGTVLDFGSHAPPAACVGLFASHDVEITVEEARVPTGLPKWEHIRALGRRTRIATDWAARHGSAFCDADVDALYAEFTPMLTDAVGAHAHLVPGVADLVAALRERGIRIGSTTGYNRAIMEVLAPLAAEQGFAPDNLVCAGDLPASRPTPLGLYRCFVDLNVWPAHQVLKVDDTVPGLLEGRHAGCWTAAVTASGNAMGLTLGQWRALQPCERAQRLVRATSALYEARPDFVIETVAGLMTVVDEIDARLRAGLRPQSEALHLAEHL